MYHRFSFYLMLYVVALSDVLALYVLVAVVVGQVADAVDIVSATGTFWSTYSNI